MKSQHQAAQPATHSKDISRRGPEPAGGKRRGVKPTANPIAAVGTAKPRANQTAKATAAGADTRHLRRVAGEFNGVLDKCALHPAVETVHRVRTGSRRVQATIETLLREAGVEGKALEKPAKAWMRQLKSIRRAAAPVRDLDVHRKLLEKALAKLPDASPEASDEVSLDSSNDQCAERPSALREPDRQNTTTMDRQGEGVPAIDESAGEANPEADWEAHPRSSQAQVLDAWLKDKRHARVEVLEKQIKKRREKLAERQATFVTAVERVHSRRLRAPRRVAAVALENFVHAADALPSLDSSNLHAFRKRIKKARYVAESGGEEPDSRTLAKALKRVQDAIGSWHDWQCLAGEAKTVLGEDALGKDGAELTAWLESKAERSLANALRTTGQIRGRLMGEWIATQSQRRRAQPSNLKRAPRKPPSRAVETRVAGEPAAG